MAIAQRGTPTAVQGTTLPFSLTLPSGIQDNDGELVLVGVGDTADVVPTPSGWTLANHTTRGTGANVGGYVFRKVGVEADSGAALSLGTSDAVKGTAIGLAFSGTDTSNPVHQIQALAETASQTTHTTPTVTTTVDGCWILLAVVHKDNSSTAIGSTPSGYTLVASSVRTSGNGVCSMAVYAKGPVSPGTYGGESIGFDAATANAVTFTIALAPTSTTQTLRPASDVTTTNVTGVPDTTTLAHNIDETTLNTSDYVEFIQGATYETKLSAGSDPGTTAGFQATYVLGLGDGATSATWDVYLMMGTTQIAHWTDEVTEDSTAVSHTLTSDEAGDIDDFTDLRLRFVLTAVS
jgi:hypothetical protein